MFKLPVHNPELVAERLAELKSDFNSVLAKLCFSQFFSADDVAKLQNSKAMQKAILTEIDQYAEDGFVATRQSAKGTLKKPEFKDFALIKLLQYVYGSAVVELGVAANNFPTPSFASSDYPPGTIPYVRGGDVIAYVDHPNPHHGEAVVITALGNAGKVRYYNEPVVLGQCLAMDVTPAIFNARFLYHSLKGREFDFGRLKAGTGVPTIPTGVLKTQRVSLPNLEVQEQIAAKFDHMSAELEEIEQKLERVNSTYRYFRNKLVEPPKFTSEQVQARVQQLETNFATVCAKVGLNASKLEANKDKLIAAVQAYKPALGLEKSTKLFKETINLVQYVYGSAVLQIQNASSPVDSSPIRTEDQPDGDIPLVSNGVTPLKYISHDNPLLRPAVVMARKGFAGSVYYWEPPVVLSDVLGLEGLDGVTLTKYLYYAIKLIEHNVRRLASGTGVPGIPKSTMKIQLISVVPLAQQQDIITKLEHLEQLQANLTAKRDALQKIYNYALDRTFSGTYGDN